MLPSHKVWLTQKLNLCNTTKSGLQLKTCCRNGELITEATWLGNWHQNKITSDSSWIKLHIMWKGKICQKARKDAMIKLKFSFSPLYVNTKIRARGHITPISKLLVVPVIWLALIDAIYSQMAPIFALNRIFFPANEEATQKTKQPIRF